MKKLLAILAALLPIGYVAALFLLFLMDSGDELLIIVLFGYPIFALAVHILFSVFTAHAKAEYLSINNVFLYLGNLLLLIAECIYWGIQYHETKIATENGAMGGGLGLVLLILIFLPHWVCYLQAHIVGVINCCRILRNKDSGAFLVLHVMLQLLPATDLLSSIWILLRTRKRKNMA